MSVTSTRAPVCGQLLGERSADVADALDEHGAIVEAIRPEGVTDTRAQTVEDAARGVRPGVAGPAVRLAPAVDVGVALGDEIHVRRRGVHVRARVERRAERARRAPRSGGGSGGARLPSAEPVTATTAFPPPKGMSRSRHLQRHRLREVHRVLQRVGRLRVRLHPRTPAGRAEAGRMDAHEHPRPARLVEPDDDLLAVPPADEVLEHGENLAVWRRAAVDASWPQAASMSRPRVSLTVAGMRARSSTLLNRSIVSRDEPSYMPGRVVGDEVDLERLPAEYAGERRRPPGSRSRRRASRTRRRPSDGAARRSVGTRRGRRRAGSGRSPASARDRFVRSAAWIESARRIGCSTSSTNLVSPGIHPTVEIVVRRGVIPMSGRRRADARTCVDVQERLAHAHVDRVVYGLAAPEVERLVDDLRRGQVSPEAHRAGCAERARERAARLRGEAQRPAAVAVAHEHRFDRMAVGGTGRAPSPSRRATSRSVTSSSVENGTVSTSVARSAFGSVVMSS